MTDKTKPHSYIILVGKLDADDAKTIDRYAEKIKQTAFLSIIGIQESVDVKVLDKVADYSFSFELNKGVPVNIQDVIEQAYGCHT